MEQEAAGEAPGDGNRRALTQGMILDETPIFIPFFLIIDTDTGMHHRYAEVCFQNSRTNFAKPIKKLEVNEAPCLQVVSTTSLSIVREWTDPVPVTCPVHYEAGQSRLRQRALWAAMLRAYTCVNQYIFFFTVDDERFRAFGVYHPFHGPESVSKAIAPFFLESWHAPNHECSYFGYLICSLVREPA
jgi:hypothetical protein